MSRVVRDVDPRRARRIVVAATALVTLVAGAWSVVLPLGEGPDEPAHLGLVLHLADGHPYPAHDELTETVGVERFCTTFVASVRVCPRPGEQVTATAVRVRGTEGVPHATSRPAWDDDGGAASTGDLNQMAQHPPLYYRSMAIVLDGLRAVAGGPLSLDRELGFLRLVNVALVSPLPALAFLATRRLGGDRRAAATAALLTAGLPMLSATAGTLNNDNLLTLLGACAAPLLAALAAGDRSRRTVVATGLVIGAALLTKAFAVVLVPAALLACWVGSGRRVGSFARPVGVLGLVVAVISGWWYLRTWISEGSPTPSADADRYTEALRPPGFSADVFDFGVEFAGRFSERFWGSFGWYSARMPGPVTVLLTVTALVLLVAGLVAVRRRAMSAVLLLPACLLLGLTASRAWTLHARSGQYPFIQGRYLFAGLVGLAVVAALGWSRLWRARWSLPSLVVVVTLLQIGALARGLSVYWSGGLAHRIEAVDAWSGLPDMVPTLLVAGAPASALAVLVVVVRTAVADRAPVPSAVP